MMSQNSSADTAARHTQSKAPRPLLIVDDDDIFRERLCRAMERRGFETFGAASIEEMAVAALQILIQNYLGDIFAVLADQEKTILKINPVMK